MLLLSEDAYDWDEYLSPYKIHWAATCSKNLKLGSISSGSNVRMVKKCKANLKALWECPRQELQNEPPLGIAVRLPQNPLMASLIQRLAIKGIFGVVVQLYQVGSCFEGLIEGVLVAPSDLPWIFFTSLTFLPEWCGSIYQLQVQKGDTVPRTFMKYKVHEYWNLDICTFMK